MGTQSTPSRSQMRVQIPSGPLPGRNSRREDGGENDGDNLSLTFRTFLVLTNQVGTVNNYFDLDGVLYHPKGL